MDYGKHYNLLIDKAVKRGTVTGYKERHHIVPVCMGGNNDKSNLVYLTAREHFVAHVLLYKEHKKLKTQYTSKLSYAVASFRMNCISKNNGAISNSRRYSEIRKYASECLRIHNKLLWTNPVFRSKRLLQIRKQNSSSEYKANMKIAIKLAMTETDMIKNSLDSRKLYWKSDRSDNHRSAISNQFKGVPKTEEHKSKIGRKGMIMVQNINTLEIKRVLKTDYELMDSSIWVNPRKITPEVKYKCSVCGLETTPSNLKRWHNDKCTEIRSWTPWLKSINKNNLDLYANIDQLFDIFTQVDNKLSAKTFGIEMTKLILESNNSVLINYTLNKKHLINKVITQFKQNYNPKIDKNWIKFKKDFTYENY